MVFGVKGKDSKQCRDVKKYAGFMSEKSKEMQLMPWDFKYKYGRSMTVFSFEPLAPPIFKLSIVFFAIYLVFSWSVFLVLGVLFMLFKFFWWYRFYFYLIKLGMSKQGYDSKGLEFVKERVVAVEGWFNNGAN